jgi:DNA helicase HerA-like ATPase
MDHTPRSNSAYSIDGRVFHFTADVDAGLVPGGYVRIDTEDRGSYLGQILDLEAGEAGPTITSVIGNGAIRSVIEGGEHSAPASFGSAALSPADPAAVRARFEASQGATARLDIGALRHVGDGVPATFRAEGFGRHTFVCGQSGSGKTYTLGAVLERLLLETNLRLVILDPNSDYVRLGELRGPSEIGIDAAAHAELASRYEAVASKLFVHGAAPGERPLRSRFGRLSLEQQALVLDLQPLRDADEFNVFRRIVRSIGTTEYTLGEVRARAGAMFDEGSRRLALRIDNLGVEDLGIWAPVGEPALADLIPDDWRALVFDLGSLPSSEERSMMSASIIEHLWRHRHERVPTLLVIDEAHNVCPQTPADRFQALASADLASIAGEGRKFGLFLLLVTQRPQKVHANVLSQCDNLVLMRMNSAADIEHLSTTFSHVPKPLISQAASFGLGEGLAAGKIATDPLLFKTGSRYSAEGGSDIPTTWAGTR